MSNIHLSSCHFTVEELINWIQKETPEGAAFAGPMPITSTILLTTQRLYYSLFYSFESCLKIKCVLQDLLSITRTTKMFIWGIKKTSSLSKHLDCITFLFNHFRERTKEIYRAFGRGTVADLYPSLTELKVSYLVIQDHWCFGEPR